MKLIYVLHVSVLMDTKILNGMLKSYMRLWSCRIPYLEDRQTFQAELNVTRLGVYETRLNNHYKIEKLIINNEKLISLPPSYTPKYFHRFTFYR